MLGENRRLVGVVEGGVPMEWRKVVEGGGSGGGRFTSVSMRFMSIRVLHVKHLF